MADDDYTVQSYQEDLDDDNKPDPFMDEVAEDPAESVFGAPDPTQFTEKLDEELDDDDIDPDDDDIDIEEDESQNIEDIDTDDPDDRGY